MKTPPSKELLSKVLDVVILDCKVVGNGIAYNAKDNYPTQSVNIYELVHIGNCVVYRIEADPEESLCITNADTEPFAIFKACEWILEQTRGAL